MATPTDPKTLYAEAFACLGVPLQPRDACSEEDISTAEHRLGVRTPPAIRAYFLLAGRERRLNQAHNHLLLPPDWFLDAGHLVFLAENQNVVFWGTALQRAEDDAPVLQGVNGDQIQWHPEHRCASEFLTVMLHWQAVMGGFTRTWSAVVDGEFPTKLSGWRYAGEVNAMHAYSRDGVALCWLRWEDEWRIFASSIHEDRLDRLAQVLGLAWDPSYE